MGFEYHPSNGGRRILLWSGRRDSNPRISAWKADALPLGDSRAPIIVPLAASKVKEKRSRGAAPGISNVIKLFSECRDSLPHFQNKLYQLESVLMN